MINEEATHERTVHDLKNQLGIVLGFTELLWSECPVDDPRRADLDVTRTAARAALALVDQLSRPRTIGTPHDER